MSGRGWLDCQDCVNCKRVKTPQGIQDRYCVLHGVAMPSPADIDFRRTLCTAFEEAAGREPLKNQVAQTADGFEYVAERSTQQGFQSSIPRQPMNPNTLYGYRPEDHALVEIGSMDSLRAGD